MLTGKEHSACASLSTPTPPPGDLETVGSQIARLRTWAQTQDGTVAPEHVYQDVGAPEIGLNRPGLARARLAIRRGEVDLLAVTTLDRLAGRQADQMLLVRELQRAGCALTVVDQPAPAWLSRTTEDGT